MPKPPANDAPRRCAHLTMADPTGFVIYDDLVREPLAALGWSLTDIPWDSEGIDWSTYDAVVVRSTWDYQARPEPFLAVLDEIDNSAATLLNPLSTIRWNMDKRYLQEMERAGIPIVPTSWQEAFDPHSLGRLMDDLDSGTVVVKPLVGANADDTFVLGNGARPGHANAAAKRFTGRRAMVQPYLKSIVADGEFSLFYFGDAFSHAVLKRPADGDFRVQEEHGGAITAASPPPDIRSAADTVVSALAGPLLYARVDLVRLADGSPVLIEVELIEPSLYFPFDPLSPRRYARALDALCP